MSSFNATKILDGVEQWADKYWMLRETTCFVEGRIDALLIPTAYDAHCIKKSRGHWTDGVRVCGVEVKADRSDFLKGLRKGQYDRYAKTLGGLYIASFPSVCRTSELPAHCGHLVFTRKLDWGRVVCKRHPQYRDVKFTQQQMWALFYRHVEHARQEAAERRLSMQAAMDKIGHRASAEVFAALRAMRKQVESQSNGKAHVDDDHHAGGLVGVERPDVREEWEA